MTTRITAILILLYAQTSFAAVWFVDKDNLGIEDGMSWATAFTTIQPAIDAAFADGGGEVWVAEGTYDEVRVSMLHSPPLDTGSLLLKDGVVLLGGFVGTETMPDQRDPAANITTVDGSIARSGQPAFHVVFGGQNSVLDGFTITGGRANDSGPFESRRGGGLYNESTGLVVTNCYFTDNRADANSGGAIRTVEAIDLTDSAFLNNFASSSGAYSGGVGSHMISRCRFEANAASGQGGAISVGGGQFFILEDCLFDSNQGGVGSAIRVSSGRLAAISSIFTNNSSSSTSSVGGAVNLIHATEVTITNCVFALNTSDRPGGAIGAHGIVGMDLSSTTNVEVTNCTFWGNSSQNGAGAIHTEGSIISVLNSILWNNGPQPVEFIGDFIPTTVDFTNIQGGFPGTGNIDAEPFFVDPENGDFRVFTGSPVIDAGTATGAPATDINGIARPQGAGFDMGAHESDGSLPSIPAAQTAALITLTALLVAIPVLLLWNRHTGTS